MLVKKQEFYAFLAKVGSGGPGSFREVFLPTIGSRESDGKHYFSRFRDPRSHNLDGYRPVDPLKLLIYQARDRVAPFQGDPPARIVAGVKACDLEALSLLDRALINDEFIDPAYKAWRQKTTIISADCTEIAPSCHCTLVGGKPYAEAGFDMNISAVGDSYLLTTAGGQGEELLSGLQDDGSIRPAEERAVAAVAERRAEMIRLLNAQNEPFARPDEYSGLRTSPSHSWTDQAKTCIGCGACTNICPTCYCLILNDESEAGDFIKVRSYDSCQWHGYARVAAGASPRPLIHERFRNRYLCKFLYMKSNFGRLGCTGCGRCTDACPGEIEFRAVLQTMTEKTTPAPEIPPAAEGGCDESKPL